MTFHICLIYLKLYTLNVQSIHPLEAVIYVTKIFSNIQSSEKQQYHMKQEVDISGSTKNGL